MSPGIVLTGIAIVVFLAVLVLCVVIEEWMNR
jgi:hypothetical protein